IAATINGTPISRLSVIRELETNSGQQALDILITKKLIDMESIKMNIVVSETDINTEIQKLETRLAEQGGTLQMILDQQGMTEAQLREQVALQKKLENILNDKIGVTDEEVQEYITKNKLTPPTGTDENIFKDQVRDQLKNQKFNVEAGKWIDEIKASATIKYYVDYGAPEVIPALDTTEAAPVSSSGQ
ncbi:MAG TPA: hypothetical protein VJH89_02280, partial [Patescibacteria group bacterium]|nr:hypothetical protein [Patescibacteria group bacterium]